MADRLAREFSILRVIVGALYVLERRGNEQPTRKRITSDSGEGRAAVQSKMQLCRKAACAQMAHATDEARIQVLATE